jgi:hypothetical protein
MKQKTMKGHGACMAAAAAVMFAASLRVWTYAAVIIPEEGGFSAYVNLGASYVDRDYKEANPISITRTAAISGGLEVSGTARAASAGAAAPIS